MPIAQLNDHQKIVLIDGVLNVKSSQPAQVEQQIDEFKKSAVKLQQGQDYFALLDQNLVSGNNPYLTIRAKGSFHVSTPKQENDRILLEPATCN